MPNYLFNNDLQNNPSAFDELYKTADILISTKQKATNFLMYADTYEKFNLFNLADEIVSDQYFKNWRNYKNPREENSENTDSIFKVSKKIKLYLDNTNIPTGYSYDLGKISDLTKSGAFSALQNIAEGVAQFNAIRSEVTDKNVIYGENSEASFSSNYQPRINPLKNVPYFQNLSTSTIDNLSFTFSWGQFGLYNCELEVVKPIFALANCFGFSIDSEGYIQTPFDAKFDVTTKAYSKLFSRSNENQDVIMGRNNGENLGIGGIGDLTKKLNEIYTKVAGSTSVTAALIRIGAGVFGPVYVSEVNWEFDYSQQDEYGMPYKGKIMLNGIKPLLIEDTNGFNKSGGVNLSLK